MRRLLLLTSLSLCLAVPGRAQTTETPVPFDTASRILSVRPALVTRLGLTAPGWPVTGEFVEAKLFRISDGGYVIVVARSGGATDRYRLTEEQAGALRGTFSDAMAKAGRVVGEDASSFGGESARGSFVRDQMLLATIIYGPALATLTDDPTLGTAAYLGAVGGTFFGLMNMSKTRLITKAQNSLTTDGALRGWAATGLAVTALGADLDENGGALTALAGGIGGSLIGFNRGRYLTNSEAQASMTLSTLGAGAAIGTAVTLDLLRDRNNEEQVGSAAVLIGGIAGYVLGPKYPRRAGYTVTAGDVQLLRLGSIIGAAAASLPIAQEGTDDKVVAGAITAGWIGGALLSDRIAARPFDYSPSDARMMQLGALGGALMGAILPVLSESDSPRFIIGTVTGGAIVGAFLTHGILAPPRQGEAFAPASRNNDGAVMEFDLGGLAMTAAKRQGNHSLLRIRF